MSPLGRKSKELFNENHLEHCLMFAQFQNDQVGLNKNSIRDNYGTFRLHGQIICDWLLPETILWDLWNLLSMGFKSFPFFCDILPILMASVLFWCYTGYGNRCRFFWSHDQCNSSHSIRSRWHFPSLMSSATFFSIQTSACFLEMTLWKYGTFNLFVLFSHLLLCYFLSSSYLQSNRQTHWSDSCFFSNARLLMYAFTVVSVTTGACCFLRWCWRFIDWHPMTVSQQPARVNYCDLYYLVHFFEPSTVHFCQRVCCPFNRPK